MQAARMAGWMALAGAPIMAALFMLFPRIAPLWGLPGDAMSGRSGLSGQMQVGTIASLALDDSIAMRIKFDGPPPPQDQMYFRGPVFSTFDGREWKPLRSAFPTRAQLQPELAVRGNPVSYQVTLAANNRPWLMVLDATPQAPEIRGYNVSMGPDLQWQADQPIADLVRYRATSYPDFRHGPSRLAVGLQDYLDLPPGFNPRTLQLAADLRRQPELATAGAQALVDAVMNKLRTGGYEYTLEPGVYGTHTADEFWFDRKAGFCEHIASSFVLLMRALDIPARVVTGYQGGQVNTVDSFWTVRQSDAHAWAEVWMAGRGWVRVDPTSAVAPARTGTFRRLQPQPNVFTQALNTVSPGFSVNLRALWEATNNRWNQWVLNYSQAKQMDLLRNIGFSAPDWQDLSTVLIVLIVTASLAALAGTGGSASARTRGCACCTTPASNCVKAVWPCRTMPRPAPWLRCCTARRTPHRKAKIGCCGSKPGATPNLAPIRPRCASCEANYAPCAGSLPEQFEAEVQDAGVAAGASAGATTGTSSSTGSRLLPCKNACSQPSSFCRPICTMAPSSVLPLTLSTPLSYSKAACTPSGTSVA